jgi:arylsulfatase A-like enzyme
MVHYFDPHFPYRPPERFVGPPALRQTAEGGGARKRATMRDIANAIKILKASGGRPDAYVENLHDLYCAEIRYMDEEIGRIVGRFRGAGRIEDGPIIIFTADHGETFWEHAEYFGHGETVFETGIKIPLIFNCPGVVPAGVRDDTPLSNLDMAPTLCRLAGVAPPAAFEGESFADLVRAGEGGLDAGRLRFAEATKPYQAEEKGSRPNIFKAKSVRRGNWKYIEAPHTEKDGALFNLAEDPAELDDLSGLEENANLLKALRTELWRWAKTFDPARSGGQTLDPEVQKRLEQLGY